MPPRRGAHLAMADKTLLDNPELFLIRPMPTADTISSGKNFDLRAIRKVGHKGGLIIGSQPKSDGRRRSLTIRPIALNRKNALFAGHDAGAQNWAMLASLIETCKLNAIDPHAWITATLRAIINGHKQSDIDALLP